MSKLLQMISSKKSHVMIMLTAHNSSRLRSNLVNMTNSLYKSMFLWFTIEFIFYKCFDFQPLWLLIISSWVQLFIHKQALSYIQPTPDKIRTFACYRHPSFLLVCGIFLKFHVRWLLGKWQPICRIQNFHNLKHPAPPGCASIIL